MTLLSTLGTETQEGERHFMPTKVCTTSRLSISLVREGKKWMEEGRGKERMKKEPTEGRV